MSQYKRYELPTVLNGDALILNTEKGILTQLAGEEIKEQQLLTDTEMYLIAELLGIYPDYCPYEVLLSAQSNETLDKCHDRVQWALEEGTIDAVMRPVRNLLSRCRMKLHPFGLEITSLHETGYLLTPIVRKGARRLTPERY
jgi:hypothetical protein